MTERPILVKAIHSYVPVNNDEIKLELGEILTVTRKEDGGWWEGTLSNGKTGWFPSNYVNDISQQEGMSSSVSLSSLGNGSGSYSSVGKLNNSTVQDGFGSQSSFGDLTAFAAQQAEYRKVSFQELLDSETTHFQELQLFMNNYMIPLQRADIVSAGEYKIIIGNLTDVINFHLNSIINVLNLEQSKPATEQRIGSLFLEMATKFENVHKLYCSNHPKAVQVVEKYKEQLSTFVESKGARKPGILYLITSLSQPFRRLERYPALLQEIERHVEEFHKDRGDLQRSIEYYKEIQKMCGTLRKQKEMELEVLSGAIKDWEGADVSQLGDIVFMNLVHLGYERLPRYLVLFSNTLLILSYNTETNCLVYEGKVPVTGITVRSLPEQENLINAIEIAGPMIDQIIINCTGKSIRDLWLDHLNHILKSNRLHSFSSSPQQSFGQLTPPMQAWNIARLRPAPSFNPFLAEYLTNLKKSKQQHNENISNAASTTSLNLNQSSHNNQNKNGGINRSASTGGGFPLNYNLSSTSLSVTNEDDFAVLSLVDSFCTKNRHTVSSASMNVINSLAGIAPLDQKQQVSVATTNTTKPQPKTLAQLVLSLQDEVSTLKQSMGEEQKKRRALQSYVHKGLSNTSLNNSSAFGNNGPMSLPSSTFFNTTPHDAN